MDATALRRGGSRSELNSSKREAPRGESVASEDFGLILFSNNHETPRGEPVASFDSCEAAWPTLRVVR